MKVAIIGAMDKEIERYLEIYDAKRIQDRFEIYESEDILIVKCGIGKVNSSIMTQHLIDKYNVDVIISSGCAGALTNEYNVLDVIIPEYVTYHDFLPERVMKYSTPDEGKIKVDEKLRNIFIDVISAIDGVNYVESVIASGDCYVTDSITSESIIKSTGATVVDMESASIGHTAKFNNIPFLTIRTISDFADGADEFETKASYLASEIISKCVEKLLNKKSI